MEIEVLISTMNLIEPEALLKKMNVRTNSIIINQYAEDREVKDEEKKINKLYNYKERGLSKSRNHAIEKSTKDICVIADDDIKYEDDYETKILKSYEKYPDADIIAFYVTNGKKKRKEGKINFFSAMQIQSVQLTFKRKSIIDSNIKFNEQFGAGAELYMGEENIFLAECLKKGLKIYYVPETIAEVENGNSTWFKGFEEKYFETKGANFYALSKPLSSILILQFALRKYKKYHQETNIFKAIKCMYKGKKEYKKSIIKRIYMMGDFISNTGPAMVNKNYYPYIKEKCYICKSNNKFKRVIHFLKNIGKCDTLLISGLSKFHAQASIFTKKINRNVVYLMHGYAKLEYEINEVPLENRNLLKAENIILNQANDIICVSEKFNEYLKENLPELKEKITFVNNGVEIKSYNKNKKNNLQEFKIVSVGGRSKNKE